MRRWAADDDDDDDGGDDNDDGVEWCSRGLFGESRGSCSLLLQVYQSQLRCATKRPALSASSDEPPPRPTSSGKEIASLENDRMERHRRSRIEKGEDENNGFGRRGRVASQDSQDEAQPHFRGTGSQVRLRADFE